MSNRKIINAAATGGIGYYPVGNPTDAYYDNVSLLLNGDVEVDSNFANVSLLLDGNTIADKSNNKATITNTGSVTVSSTVKKFGTGSLNFTTGSQSLSIPTINLTGDFTIEGWFYKNYNSSFSIFASPNGGDPWFGFNGDQTLYFGSATNQVTLPSSINNTWAHIAIVRVGTSIKAYINGVNIAGTNYTLSGTVPVTIIGAFTTTSYTFNGYIDDFRITNGVARYTANFTLPVKALPTHEILDSSVYRLPVTAYGNARIDTATKKYGTGSMYFDGSGDYCTFSASNSIVGSGDFTIEAWVYLNVTTGPFGIIGNDTNNGFVFSIGTTFGATSANGLRLAKAGVADCEYASYAFNATTWYYVAVTRTNNTITFFVNNNALTTLGSGASSFSFVQGTSAYIGAWNSTGIYMNGFIDDLRITKGIARTITQPSTSLPTIPPTIPADPWWGNVSLLLDGNTTDAYDPYWQNVSLMLTGDDFIDWSNQHNAVTNNGTVTLSTSTKKFNSSSIALSGSNYLTVPYSTTLFDWWVSDFTLECWVNPTTLSSFQQTSNISAVLSTLIGNATATSTANYWSFGPLSNGTVRFYYYNGSGVAVTSTATISATQWSHIAMTKNSSGIQIWVNGVGNGYTAISGTPQSSTSTTLTIGEFQSVGANGYIADLRITKGVARYTVNFTPPIAALPSFKIQDRTQNNLTLTPYGNVQLSTDVMKNGTGSMFFDGTGDYLTLNDSSNLLFGTSDFTIECWFMQNSTVTDSVLVTNAPSNTLSANYFVLHVNHSSNPNKFSSSCYNINPSAQYIYGTTDIVNGKWYHVALVRSGSTFNLYVNGILEGTATSTANIDGSTLYTKYIGGAGNATLGINGYIDDLRITKGYARYTQNFTPPSQSFATQYISTGYDPNYADVSLLLNGNGTNGSTTFTDLSSSPKTVTAYGDTKISTAVKKYGTGAMYFDGTGDYLKIPISSAFDFGTSDFTIEMWYYKSGTPQEYGRLLQTRDGDLYSSLSITHLTTTNTIMMTMSNNGSSYSVSGNLSPNVVDNNWTHIAVVRNGSNITGYVNGVGTVISTTYSGSPYYIVDNMVIGGQTGGRCITGYIDDLRITKGVARYTTNFTPPTYQLPTDTTGTVIDPLRSSTSLLLRGNGTNGSTSFTDESPNGLTVTNNGSVTVNTTTKKYGTGSIYSDGTGTNYLTIQNGSHFAFGTGDFTIELWVYIVSAKYSVLFDTRNSGDAGAIVFLTDTSNKLWLFLNGVTLAASTNAITSATWTHVAVSRYAGTVSTYINGVSGFSVTNNTNLTGTGGWIGAIQNTPSDTTYRINGYIDDLRITKGYARYTANFTPPTYEDPIVTGTVYDYNYPQVSLLLNGDGTNGSTVFTDLSSNPKTITNTGSVAVNTSVKKFGTGSIAFSGSNYLTIPSSSQILNFGTGNFTIEMWCYVTSGTWPTYVNLLDGRSGDIYAAPLIGIFGGKLDIVYDTSARLTAGTVSLSTWNHFAFVRNNTSLIIYLNGVNVGSVTISSSLSINSVNSNCYIGAGVGLNWYLSGYIDDLRITKGLARYTTNFTPPTAPLPTSYS